MAITANDEQIANRIRHGRNAFPMLPCVRQRVCCCLATTLDAENCGQGLTEPTLMGCDECFECVGRRHRPSLF